MLWADNSMKSIPAGKYTVLYADPPWAYGDKGFGKREGGAVSGAFAPEAGRYNTMPISEILAMGEQIRRISAKQSALFLWATSPLLPEALDTMRAWGFEFRTVAFCWSKKTSTGKSVTNLGQYTLGNVELCLLGIRGSPSPKRESRTVRQLVRAERGEHSAKPAEIRDRIVELFGDVPRLELFARQAVPGWDAWGDGVPN